VQTLYLLSVRLAEVCTHINRGVFKFDRAVVMESLWSRLTPGSPDDALVFLAASFVLKVAICWIRGSRPPPSASFVGYVTAAKLYPVKSVGGIELNEAECTQSGLKMPGLQLCDR